MLFKSTFLLKTSNFQLFNKIYNGFWIQKNSSIYTRPRRALLYVPGDDERKLRKATNLNVDCLIFDCEDGVAVNRKDLARKTIARFLSTHKHFDNNRTDYGIRVNSLQSGQLDEDLRVICGSPNPPKTIFLPKVNDVRDFRYFGEHLKSYLLDKKQKLHLLFFAESCITIMDLPQICRRAIELSQTYPFHVAGIIFGSDDFCASLGATRTETSEEILYARQRIVLVAKAFNLQAIDMVYIDLEDENGLKCQSEEGASFGYTGKQVIHPKQVPIVQSAFMPSKEKIKWATELLEAYHNYQKSGKGAFVFQNKMIDAPTIKQAQNVLELIKSIPAEQ